MKAFKHNNNRLKNNGNLSLINIQGLDQIWLNPLYVKDLIPNETNISWIKNDKIKKGLLLNDLKNAVKNGELNIVPLDHKWFQVCMLDNFIKIVVMMGYVVFIQ